MADRYSLVFDPVIVKQLKKAARNKQVKEVIAKMLDSLELLGPLAGKLLDPRLHLYEMKIKRPPLRLYYKYIRSNKEIHIFEYEMKTSKRKQKDTIKKLRRKSKP